MAIRYYFPLWGNPFSCFRR